MMCRWCLGRVSVMCSDWVVMFWWYVGDALVLCWWCLCSVSVMLWCLSDGWWCCGDRDDIVMFRWWILMNILRFSVGSEEKRVAVRCVFAIGVVCWANFLSSSPVHPFFFRHLFSWRSGQAWIPRYRAPEILKWLNLIPPPQMNTSEFWWNKKFQDWWIWEVQKSLL